jgi:hypothetical protein
MPKMRNLTKEPFIKLKHQRATLLI